MKTAEIAIVGGGVAGLVAAATLARQGLQPRLFEAAPELGGRAQTRIVDGFHFNQGPHALYVRGAFNAVLAELGVPVSGHRLRLDGAMATWGDVAHPLPTRPAAGRVAAPLNPAEGARLAEVLAQIGEGAAGDRGAPLRAFTEGLPGKVRMVIEALVRVSSYSHAPDEIDAKAALDQVRLSFGGVLYVDGGWRALIAGLAQAATSAGAVLRSEHRVLAIRREHHAWRLEFAGQAPQAFDAVILAASPTAARDLVADSRDIATAAQAARPLRMMGLDLGLANPEPGAEFALGMDAPTYLSLHSAVAELAPPGGGLLHLGRYLAPDEAPDPVHLRELERLADRLRPDWREALVHKQRLVGIQVAHDLPGWRTEGRRTPVIVADAPGLFLAGDWVGDAGMLSDAAAASAIGAAREASALLAGRAAQT